MALEERCIASESAAADAEEERRRAVEAQQRELQRERERADQQLKAASEASLTRDARADSMLAACVSAILDTLGDASRRASLLSAKSQVREAAASAYLLSIRNCLNPSSVRGRGPVPVKGRSRFRAVVRIIVAVVRMRTLASGRISRRLRACPFSYPKPRNNKDQTSQWCFVLSRLRASHFKSNSPMTMAGAQVQERHQEGSDTPRYAHGVRRAIGRHRGRHGRSRYKQRHLVALLHVYFQIHPFLAQT
jgi:hypothetical protein